MLKVTGQKREEIISLLRKEILKEKRFYLSDGTNREERIVQAHREANDSDFCLETRFIYDGSSRRISYKEENLILWQTAWEE